MSEKKCIIYYDLIINGNEYYPEDIKWHVTEHNKDREGEFCCDSFETIYSEDELDYELYGQNKHIIGLDYNSYGESYLIPFKFCPFCAAPIEYKLKWKYKMVNKPKDCWQKEPYFGDEGGSDENKG